MRPRRVVARVVMIAALALVAIPEMAGSAVPSPAITVDPDLFRTVEIQRVTGTATTTELDPAFRSDGVIGEDSVFVEPAIDQASPTRPQVDQPAAPTGVIKIPSWHTDGNVSWYGPGFYGNRTACGYTLTTSLVGVAHRTLPCGTKVTFRNPASGRTVTVPVVDRGPYVAGRQWDLTGGACVALRHCYTGSIQWKLAG